MTDSFSLGDDVSGRSWNFWLSFKNCIRFLLCRFVMGQPPLRLNASEYLFVLFFLLVVEFGGNYAKKVPSMGAGVFLL